MHLKFSQDLESLLHQLVDHPLTFQEILDSTAERGFSLIIGLLVLPFLFPMPPGLATVLGPGCLILALQMALGKKEPWLPKNIAKKKFPRQLSLHLFNRVKQISRLLEKLTRPRLLAITKHPYIWRINGLCIAWLALLLMLPIPFTNPLPTIGILLFVIATLEADGLILCIAYLWSIVVTFLVAIMGYALVETWGLLLR
jgi:hypothetical protein